jgi:hypothetical protein
MADLLCFSRNRSAGVQRVDEETLRATCRVHDTVLHCEVELNAKLPDLEVTTAFAEIHRSDLVRCQARAYSLDVLIGMRIGPGMIKIIKGVIGEISDCEHLAFTFEECCQAVILSFTKDVLLKSPRPKDIDGAREFYAKMVRDNIRLFNRCAAFAPGSSLVKGIDPSR